MTDTEQDTRTAIREAALRALARREHARRELVTKLARKGHPRPEVEAVVAGLVDDGLLSDARFADAYVRVRTDRGYGPVRITHELRERGIDRSTIDRIVDERDERWSARLRTVCRKKYGDAPPKDAAERARQARFFHHRGFTAEQIQTLFRREENQGNNN